jgi:predicted dehydrogenase
MRALRAGKHVISEKPIAGTVAEARELVEAYRAMENPPVWNIAENFRFENVFETQAALIPRIGNVVKMDLLADMPMAAGNKYFSSSWRRDTSLCPGGFLMDSSVHFSAAMRMLAESAGAKMPVSVSAKTRSTTHLLPAPDTAIGTIEWDNGLLCTISWSFSATPTRFSLSVSGTEGTIEVTRGGWTGSRANYQMSYQLMNEKEPTFEKFNFSGADREFANFVRQAVAKDTGHEIRDRLALRGQPEAALLDLAMIECIIKSGDVNGAPVPIPHIADPWPVVEEMAK